MIGGLQYIARRSTPDVLLYVDVLIKYWAKPKIYLMCSVKRLFSYLKLTKHFALLYKIKPRDESTLSFYSDSGLDRGKAI